jgi:uncharacterized phage protein gp47/JayE
MPWGLTADGFVAKTLEEIEAGFVAQQRANIDASIDTSAFGLIGQLNGIMASEIAAVWELAEAVNDAQDPDKAAGAAQDALYALTGPLRDDATFSAVLCDVTLQPGTTIAPGEAIVSAVGNATARFENTFPMVNGGVGVAVITGVRFQALEAGPLVANAGTLTVRETLPAGWDAVTNPEDATVGTGIESDAAYRHRREDELAAEGGGTTSGIRAALLQLETVLAASVLENTDDSVVESMPPKSIWAIVRSSPGALDEQAIGETIYANKAGGIEAFGTVPVTVLDSEEVPHVVHFSRPTEVSVYVALRVTTNAEYAGNEALKTAIVASAETPDSPGYLDVGVDVYAGQFVTVAMQQRGVLNAEARVSYASTDYATGLPALVVAQTETGTVDTARISVVPIP